MSTPVSSDNLQSPIAPSSAAAIESRMAAADAPWRRTQPFDPGHKSPRLAAMLSLVPGLGQIYIGYYVRGFATAACVLFFFFTAASMHGDLGPLFVLAGLFTMLYNIVDAGRLAAMYNHAAVGLDRIDLPEGLGVPTLRGSIVGGAILLVLSLIALSNTALGLSLDWLEIWWPVLPLALGAYLLVRGVMDAQQGSQRRATLTPEQEEG